MFILKFYWMFVLQEKKNNNKVSCYNKLATELLSFPTGQELAIWLWSASQPLNVASHYKDVV